MASHCFTEPRAPTWPLHVTDMSGERQVPCPSCDGEGACEHPHLPLHHLHSECPEYAIVDCEDCGGDGWIWVEDDL